MSQIEEVIAIVEHPEFKPAMLERFKLHVAANTNGLLGRHNIVYFGDAAREAGGHIHRLSMIAGERVLELLENSDLHFSMDLPFWPDSQRDLLEKCEKLLLARRMLSELEAAKQLDATVNSRNQISVENDVPLARVARMREVFMQAGYEKVKGSRPPLLEDTALESRLHTAVLRAERLPVHVRSWRSLSVRNDLRRRAAPRSPKN